MTVYGDSLPCEEKGPGCPPSAGVEPGAVDAVLTAGAVVFAVEVAASTVWWTAEQTWRRVTGQS